MIVTKDKRDKLLNDVRNKISINCNINLPYQLQHGNLINEFKQSVEITIRSALMAGFEELLNNLYTQEDLEDDLKLTSRDKV